MGEWEGAGLHPEPGATGLGDVLSLVLSWTACLGPGCGGSWVYRIGWVWPGKGW